MLNEDMSSLLTYQRENQKIIYFKKLKEKWRNSCFFFLSQVILLTLFYTHFFVVQKIKMTLQARSQYDDHNYFTKVRETPELSLHAQFNIHYAWTTVHSYNNWEAVSVGKEYCLLSSLGTVSNFHLWLQCKVSCSSFPSF